MRYIGNKAPFGVTPDLIETVRTLSSTGLKSGGFMVENSGDNTLLDISATVGEVTDSTTTPGGATTTPMIKGVVTGYDLTTHADPGDIIAIFISFDINGNLIERLVLPTAEERRDTVDLGLVARNDADEIFLVVNTPTNVVHNPMSSVQDFFEAWGAFTIEGNEVSEYSNDLRIKKLVGKTFRNGSNFHSNPKAPNSKPSPAQDPVTQFNIKLGRTGVDVSVTASQIDPNIWDDGSTTPATVPDDHFTVQRIAMFASNVIEILPGQQLFHLLSEAKSALPTLNYVVPTDSKEAVVLAYLAVKKGTTDLSVPTDREFFRVSTHREIGGIGYQNLSSSGMVFDPGITKHGDGSISVGTTGEGIVNLFQTNEWTDDLKQYPLLAFLQQSGAHDGANDQAVLEDTTAGFPDLTDLRIYNITDGSSGLIISNTATTITATLTGGTDNDWDTNDAYEVKLEDLTTSYVIADFGTGVPKYRVTLDVLEINESNRVPVFTLFRDGNDVRSLDWGTVGTGLSNKLHARFVKTARFGYESGLVVGEAGTRNLTVSAGVAWIGADRSPLALVSSATTMMEFWYHVSGVWTKSDETQYNNTQYDDGTDLQNVGVTRYVVIHAYRGVSDPNYLYFVLGADNYTLLQAQGEQPPKREDLPEVIRNFSIYVGKLLVLQGADTAGSEIYTVFEKRYEYVQV